MGTPESAATAGDIVTMLGVSRDTVYRLAKLGDIPSFKVGRLVRFWPADVRDHLAAPRDPWVRPRPRRMKR